MSAILKKIIMLSLVLVLSFGLVALAGCGEELSQEEIDQILADISSVEFDTVSFDMDMSMSIRVSGGSDAGTMTVDASGTGAMDAVNEAMQMTMDVTMDIPGEGEQDISAEIYFVDGWMYMGMDIPELGGQWMKMSAEEAMMYQTDPVEQQLELWEGAVEVKSLGTETVNGVECYVYEMIPNMAVLSDMLTQEMSGMGMDLMDFTQFDMDAVFEMFEEFSVKQWLAQDGYLPMKTEVKVVVAMEAGDFGATGDGFDKMTMDIETVVDFYDYNQPVSIELPPEALDAEEMPLSY